MLGHTTGQSLTSSGAQTAGDNSKYHYAFFDCNELCYLLAISDFQKFQNIIFDYVILFSSVCLHTVPTKSCHSYGLILELDQLLNDREKNKRCSFFKYFIYFFEIVVL